ncbi:Retrovirus-related Pol polyprotein from transposon 297 [Araneus ventricosus]|uniref:RNA-directed DNA polymerase n=1 Tax=Araneus ventricosus TaxID=182803 RepID=A0A4Y2JWN2_ARAVE|nr:Retrovirus-related Pol polyprotein from transposon 297 [Araneus ventricosus]
MQLGDKKPSQLLHEMQDLSFGKIEESVLRMLWFQRLPITTQQIFTDKLASLALTADKIAEVSGVGTCVNSVEVESAGLNRLEAQISELTSAVQQVQSNYKRFRNASPHRRYRTRFSSLNRSFCWYHSKFGKKAHKCVAPCDFSENNGASVSVFPANRYDKCNRSTLKLVAANGSSISTFGIKNKCLDLGFGRLFNWNFIVAGVSRPILGADFLERYGLLVDIKNKKLIDVERNSTTRGHLSFSSSLGITVLSEDTQFHKLLSKFPNLTNPSLNIVRKSHGTTHCILTKGPTVFSRARRLTPEKLKAVKTEFKNLVAQGICRPSKSPWASPIHLVPKKTEWRICGDYRRLNGVTEPDRYPLPHIRDFASELCGKTVFSKLHLKRTYYLIPVEPENVQKTAQITPCGLYEFLYMPFGLRNAAQTFQRFLDDILRDLNCFVYLDDILIASIDHASHYRELEQVFQRLNEKGLVLNIEKCIFGADKLPFLGCEVSKDGISPSKEKVESLVNYPQPQDVSALRRFLSMLNFYRRFIPNAAEIQRILYDLVKGKKKRDKTTIDWSEAAVQAFQTCKNSIAQAALLAHPNSEAKLSLVVDASNTDIAGTLQQTHLKNTQPLAFFSRKLTLAESRYSTYDRELLAVYSSIKHFRHFLEGRDFINYTDHKPLTFAFQQTGDKTSPRQQRHLEFISQFSTDVRYISEPHGTPLHCDVSTGNIRPYVPKTFRATIINVIHSLAHSGAKATANAVKQRFVWTSLKKDCTEFCKRCIPCQKSKVSRHVKSPKGDISLPSERFSHIHLDVVGPLPPSKGYRYCLTAVDRFTRWPEVFPMIDQTANTIAETFYSGWISRFGVPEVVTTDQGRNFESDLFHSFTRYLGISKIRTAAYNPAANGMVERLHRQLKASLMCRLGSTERWVQQLPTILLGIRTAFKEDINASSAELVYGSNLRLPGQFLQDNSVKTEPSEFLHLLRQHFRDMRPVAASSHSSAQIFVYKELVKCSHVFVRRDAVRRPLQQPYDGPFQVLQRKEKDYKIQVKDKPIWISINGLKPVFGLKEPGASVSTFKSNASIPANELSASSTASASLPTSSSTYTTRFGRKVRFLQPVKYRPSDSGGLLWRSENCVKLEPDLLLRTRLISSNLYCNLHF